MTLARKIVIWVISILLLVYVAGSVRLVLAMLANSHGQPWWAIAGGFYSRFLLMAFLLYMLIRLTQNSPGGK